MASKISFFRSLKTKFGIMVLISSILPLVIIGFVSYKIAYYSMESAGLGQIKDTLEGGYSLVQDYYKRYARNEISKEQAILQLRNALCGPVKEIWFKGISNIDEAREFMKFFDFKDLESFQLHSDSISYQNQKIALFDSKKKQFFIQDPYFIKLLLESYDAKTTETQQTMINGKFSMRLIHDFTLAVIKIRDSGYVWAITGNPNNQYNDKAFEIFHPSIGGLNVANIKNFKGELVGKNISNMNGRIDTIKEGEIVRYDYYWQNPTDLEPRNKIILIKYFKEWNWTISSGLYEDEFFGPLSTIKTYIIIGTIFFGLLTFLIAYLINSKTLIKPIHHLLNTIRQMATGNLNIKAKVFSRDEIGELAEDFNIMAESLNNSFLKIEDQNQKIKNYSEHLEDMVKVRTEQLDNAYNELKIKNANILKDLEMAQRVQISMLPSEKDYPCNQEVELGCNYKAMTSVGGDLYDIIKLSPHIYGFLIADVSGHGVPAALITSMIKISFHTNTGISIKTGQTCEQVNHDIFQYIGDLDYYSTAYYGILNTQTGEFQYTNAGHHPALLYKKNTQEILKLDTEGLLIGSIEKANYETKSIILEPGDRIIMMTDGILEARNQQDEFYDYQRLHDFIKYYHSLNPKQFTEQLFKEVEDFSGGCPASDDRAIMLIDFIKRVEQPIQEKSFHAEIKKTSQSNVITNPEEFKILYQRALKLMNEKSYADSLEIFNQLKNIYPNDLRVINNIGVNYYHLGEFNKAAEILQEGLRKDSSHFNIQKNLSIVLKELEKNKI